ncbi:RHS repeat-associated core domain-containing protein [Streptomyces sp. NPDC088788]|uniref:RHS repeat-associated core domain-containing protein n=1 Tax=Streptomyces sp. NPDC088788 TaxID=3365898 RepID=UPI0037FB7451
MTPTDPTATGRPYRFAGTYQDPMHLHHTGARNYGTSTGRFTRNDPSGQDRRTPMPMKRRCASDRLPSGAFC